MNKTTIVTTKLLSTGAFESVPVTYFITNEDGNENIKLLHCNVHLPEDKIPDWLSPTTFVIREVFSPGNPGITVTEYSSIPCKNVDSAKFVEDAHQQICLVEKGNNT